jgi:hypothetical protein
VPAYDNKENFAPHLLAGAEAVEFLAHVYTTCAVMRELDKGP